MYFSSARLLLMISVLATLTACTRNTIEFGTIPENSATHLAYVDTVGVQLFTVLTDSFVTSARTSWLLGKYKDPFLGGVGGKIYMQLDKPVSVTTIPDGAIYDSMTLLVRLNHYYYGDTTRTQTILVNELADVITLGYGNQLYNTSSVPVKPTPLGSITKKLRPTGEDSILLRLDDAKGMELFSKLKENSADITSTDNFLNYFKGICISTGATDTSAIYGVNGAAGQTILRVHYHTTIPFLQRSYTDFLSLSNSYSFNQILTNRSGTGLVPGNNLLTDIPVSKTNNLAFSQPATGLQLKLTFPTLKAILSAGSFVRLIKAELFVKPAYQSFDRYAYRLPDKLTLATTDATSLNTGSLPDSSGGNVNTAYPVFDDVFGLNNYYRFNVTSYVNGLLQETGNNDKGLFLINPSAESDAEVTRLILSANAGVNYTTQLQLSVLIINQ